MDYEKAYKESFAKAKEYYDTDTDNTLQIYARGTMEHLFPQLKDNEDETMFNEIKQALQTKGNSSMVAWLEKHKPKAQWKPSEKQMEELNLAIKANKDPKTNDLLSSLYEDLQKL